MTKVVIDPVTRIEGHLRVTCQVENGKVVNAWNAATMFRGLEVVLKGHDPRDAWHFGSRVCGVCPTPHAHASVLATEHAMGLQKVPEAARVVRNMMEATHVGYDHILWFYVLNAFDYVNVPDALNAKPTTPSLKAVQAQVKAVVDSGQLGPFAGHWWDHPAYTLPSDLNLELTAHYLQALQVQQIANNAQAFLGGKFPMVMNYAAGGMQCLPTADQIEYYSSQMAIVKDFIDNVMLQDLLAIAPYVMDLASSGRGWGNYLSWGIYDDESQEMVNRFFPSGVIYNGDIKNVQDADLSKVKKFTKYSYYSDDAGKGKHPLDVGQETAKFTSMDDMNNPSTYPKDKYDWSQSARYGDKNAPMEVGPLADMLIAYGRGRKEAVDLVNSTLAAVGAAGKPEVLLSNLGRIVARVLRAKMNADAAQGWADELLALIAKGNTKVYEPITVPDSGEGAGGWNAPRGALAHYMRIEKGKIGAYAMVPATNWNAAPRDDDGVLGPIEKALIGMPVADPEKPLEILRVVHTFDP